jgi:hypothetical protein
MRMKISKKNTKMQLPKMLKIYLTSIKKVEKKRPRKNSRKRQMNGTRRTYHKLEMRIKEKRVEYKFYKIE